MSRARVLPMPGPELAAWREARAADGVPLPQPARDGAQSAVTVEVDGVAVGGALLELTPDVGGTRCSLRVLQTTLPRDADEHWAAAVAALEARARTLGAAVLVAGVAPELARVFTAAGFQATMTGIGKRLDPASAPELQEDRRVAVRPMTRTEREQYVVDVRGLLTAGMERAGVLSPGAGRIEELEERLARLALDPSPEDEMLMTAEVDGTPVGRAWGTFVERDGALDFLGHSIDLFPEHRGQGLTKSFLGALRRHVHEVGVRDVHLRVYGHAESARQTFLAAGAGVADVHLRKELG
ncbi:GNAT family N-acetyltransferase [Nocardioides lijunqiniae]|uniref:GNAT family N-acetyltransferase n=1 Tax=Nocardioides lijunqiniae TaxID=2760832 RepID=UPI0018783E5B|nr:GNAT family N-acetyltransferase [Nocardioides lijunqiniae]